MYLEEHIIITRVIPPKIQDNIVKRQDLNNLLSQNKDKQLITVCSPAGYGKTTLILDFLSEGKIKYGWLHIQNDINNLYTFFSYLIHSLKRENPEFGKTTLDIIESSRKRFQLPKQSTQVINLLTSTFINEFLKHFSDDITIVLDELERIDNPEWLSEVLNKIISNLPPNLHLIITTKELPDINIATLSAKRKICKIQTSDLTLKREEIKLLLNYYFGTDFSDEVVKSLAKSIGGWITGVHLLLQAHGENFSKYRSEGNALPDEIFSYFAEDIYQELDKDIKDFLLNTTLLEDFTQKDCDNLLAIKKSKIILNEILKKNVFIVPTISPGDEVRYNYQILFRKFLITKLKEEKSREEILALYNKIHQFYLFNKDIDKCIRYSILAENYKQAVKLITDNFDKKFEDGKFDIIWGWFEPINDSIYEKYPVLLYYKGLMTKYYLGDMEGSAIILSKVIKGLTAAKDEELMVKSRISLIRIYLSTGEIQKAMSETKKLLKKPNSKKNEERLSYLLAYGYYVSSEYDKSLKLLDKVLSRDDSELDPDIENDIHNLLGHINLIKGEFIRSIEHYEKILLSDFNLIDKFETLCNLVLLNAQSGNFDKAEKQLKQAKEIAELSPIPIFQIAYFLAEQGYYFEIGDYDQSIKILSEMNNLAKKLNHKYYIYLSYRLIGDSYFYSKKYNNADEYYDLAFKFMNTESDLETTEYSHMKALLVKETDFREDIEDVLLSVLDYYNKNGFVYNEVQAAFHLADFYLKKGNNALTKKYIEKVVSFAFEKEYYSFLKREIRYSADIFDFCYTNNIERKLIKDLKENVLNSMRTSGDDIQDSASIRENSHALTDLKMITLGKLTFYKRSEPVDEKLWQKKKRKLILAYLMLAPNMELTKDRIIDVFYPDTPVDSVENIFYQSISRLRKILSIDTAAKNSMIIYKDKTLSLNKDFVYYSDVQEFEQLCRKAAASGTKNDQKIDFYQRAMKLYTGNFMEGYYDTWIEERRQTVSNIFFTAGKNLLELLSKQHRYGEIITYARIILNSDKLNEDAYEGMIKAMVKTGNKKGAEDVYKELMKSYKTELDDEPDPELMERLDIMLA